MPISYLEILAPVGNNEMLSAAVFSGANAIYLGLGDFNARKTAGNFSETEITDAISFCHTFGVKAYVVLNTVIYKNELASLCEAIRAIANAGADAVIVQDLTTAFLCKQIAPHLALHASTQLACINLSGAIQLAKMGFSRVILARELSFEEIEHITKNCNVETEVFVHGAMCMGVSGQCYLSAFLGGRSGNRGECAGPCRLPFSANSGTGAVSTEDGDFHLSLKDQSLVDYLPKLKSIGVASAKIEGRLRSAEYVAAAVNACKCALAQTEYDKSLLQEIFSRDGFSDGYFSRNINGQMFGVRAKEDVAISRAAMPKLRELFRRPIQSVSLDIKLCIASDLLSISATDGDGNFATLSENCILQQAQSDTFVQNVEKSLAKLGGTPFFAKNIVVEIPEKSFLPLSQINELRRRVCEILCKKRGAVQPPIPREYSLPCFAKHSRVATKIFARFDAVCNIPQDIIDCYDKIILPVSQFNKVDDALLPNLVAELPRGIFGDDSSTKNLVLAAIEKGVTHFEINNIGHLNFFENLDKVTLYSGFALNITNPISAMQLAQLGVAAIVASPETKLSEIGYFDGAKIGIIGYGHLPLMITRACPLHNIQNCTGCSKQGVLRDRKGKSFKVLCDGHLRHIYNPIPLYMGDRQRETACDFATLYFTGEAPDTAKQITLGFINGSPFDGEFTRGLYY